jgi:hypothetical protein
MLSSTVTEMEEPDPIKGTACVELARSSSPDSQDLHDNLVAQIQADEATQRALVEYISKTSYVLLPCHAHAMQPICLPIF